MTRFHNPYSTKNDDNLKAGARGGAIAFFLKTVSTGLAFVNQVILARILGAGGIGEVLLAISVVKVIGLIGKFGMDEAMMRFVPFYSERKDEARLKGSLSFALSFCLILSSIIAVVLWSCSQSFSLIVFHSEGLSRLLPFAAVTIPIAVLYEVIGGIMKGFRETLRALLPQFIISPLLRIVVFLYLSDNGSEPLYAIVAFIVGELLALIFAIAFLMKKTRGVMAVVDSIEYKKIINVAYTMIITSFGVYLFTQVDLWMVGMLTSTEKVGVYGVTAKLVTLIAFPLGAFSAIIPPLISSIHTAGNLDELRTVVRKSSRWVFSSAMPIILILVLEGDFILQHVFGKKFVHGYEALLILLIGQVINTGSGLVGYCMQMTGEHKGYMKIMVFCSVTNIILNVLLIPRFGINGAALSTAFSLAMINIVSVYVVYKKMSVLTLATELGFDVLFCAVVVLFYLIIRYNGYEVGYHILSIISLTVYIGRSFMKDHIPWRLILTRFDTG